MATGPQPAKMRNGIPYLNIDVNRWKTFVEKRMKTTPGGPGSVMFNGRPTTDGKVTARFRLLASHYTSEKCTIAKVLEREVPVWTKLSGRDNHWYDNLIVCCVLANLVGIREPTASVVKRAAPISMSAAIAAAAARQSASAKPAQGYANFRRGGQR